MFAGQTEIAILSQFCLAAVVDGVAEFSACFGKV
jgi:hypothetical protein